MDRQKRYEAKGDRPRKGFLVRLSAEEIEQAKKLAIGEEAIPAVLRRLLLERAPSPRKSQRRA